MTIGSFTQLTSAVLGSGEEFFVLLAGAGVTPVTVSFRPGFFDGGLDLDHELSEVVLRSENGGDDAGNVIDIVRVRNGNVETLNGAPYLGVKVPSNLSGNAQ